MSTPRTITALLSSPDERSRRGVIALGTGFLASLLLLTGLASSARAADRVYWANGDDVDANPISYLDGSGGHDLDTPGATVNQPRGVAIDVAAGRIYWTNRYGNAISFTGLDGTGDAGDLPTGLATVSHPNVAAIYPAERKIFWANEFTELAPPDTISWADLDTDDETGVGDDLTPTGATVVTPNGPMIDRGRLYWSNAAANVISWANLDGSRAGDLNTGTAALSPHGLALDPRENRIYWANFGDVDPNNLNAGQGIAYYDLDNGSVGNLGVNPATVNVPVGVAIDPTTRRIYWGNTAGDTIGWADLDTAVGGTLSPAGAIPNAPRSPALLNKPSGTGDPKITAEPGSVLRCSQGEWAPDLLASWLYQAPQRFEYSWTRNGTLIPGGETITTSGDGDYRCTVKATNPAGSSAQTSDPHSVASPPETGPPPVTQPPAGGATKPPTKPTAEPAFGSKTLVTLGVGARRISGSGPVKVVIRNRNEFEVSARLSTRASRRVSVSRSFSIRAKGKTTVTLKLSKTLKRLLKREGKLSLRLTTTVKDPAGGTRTVKKTVLLRLKRA